MRLRMLFAALAFAGACGSEPTDVAHPVPVATPGTAEVRAVSLEELVAAIEARRGQPLLINFWAMWCKPCVEELPDLMRAAARLRAQGGEVLAVTLELMAAGVDKEATLAKLPGFARQIGLDGPVLLFDSGDALPLIEHFGLPGPIPVTLAIDRSGAVVAMHEDRATLAEFEDLVDAALGN